MWKSTLTLKARNLVLFSSGVPDILYLAGAEDSADAVQDGPVAGSVVGVSSCIYDSEHRIQSCDTRYIELTVCVLYFDVTCIWSKFRHWNILWFTDTLIVSCRIRTARCLQRKPRAWCFRTLTMDSQAAPMPSSCLILMQIILAASALLLCVDSEFLKQIFFSFFSVQTNLLSLPIAIFV